MFKDKKNIFILTGIIFISIAFHAALNNMKSVLGFFDNVLNIISPVTVGLAVAFFLNVFLRFIEEKILKKFKGKKWLRGVGIALSVIFITCIISLLSIFILPEIKRTTILLAKALPDYVNKLIEKANSIDLPFEDISLGDIVKLDKFDDLTDFITEHSVNVVGNALNFTTSFANTLFDAVLSVIIAIYVLVYKEKLARTSVRAIYAFFSKEHADTIIEVARLSYSVFYNFITGQLTEAVILGSLCYIGMMLLGLPYAAAIGMLVGITALIPIVGAFIGIAVGAFLIVIVSPVKALVFIIYLLILQQVEGNLIYPKVVGKSVGLPDILVITAVLIGGRIGGIAAVLLSVPICSILYSLFKTQLGSMEKKNIANKKKL